MRAARSRALPGHLLEKAIQNYCERVLALNAWIFYHRPDREAGRNERSGMPDLIALHACGRLLLLECKSAVGTLRPQQEVWMRYAKRTEEKSDGWVQAALVRPGDEDIVTFMAACPCDERMTDG